MEPFVATLWLIYFFLDVYIVSHAKEIVKLQKLSILINPIALVLESIKQRSNISSEPNYLIP